MKCPNCKSDKIVKAGFNTTRKGKKQKFKCQDCGRTFYEDIALNRGITMEEKKQ